MHDKNRCVSPDVQLSSCREFEVYPESETQEHCFRALKNCSDVNVVVGCLSAPKLWCSRDAEEGQANKSQRRSAVNYCSITQLSNPEIK